MKTLFLLATLFTAKVYSQDTRKIQQIDSLVLLINNSGFPVKCDTVKYDNLPMGMKMTKYLSAIVNERELLKYVNKVNSSAPGNGEEKRMDGCNTFYYHHNRLIKVEEYANDNKKHTEGTWYFLDDKPLHWKTDMEKPEERAKLLLTLSKTLLTSIIK